MQRLNSGSVQGYDFPLPTIDTPRREVCVDGGKVRLRTQEGEPSIWRDYKAIDTDSGVVANFQNNPFLIDWVNAQHDATPIACLGDGLSGGVEYRRPNCHPTATP